MFKNISIIVSHVLNTSGHKNICHCIFCSLKAKREPHMCVYEERSDCELSLFLPFLHLHSCFSSLALMHWLFMDKLLSSSAAFSSLSLSLSVQWNNEYYMNLFYFKIFIVLIWNQHNLYFPDFTSIPSPRDSVSVMVKNIESRFH